MCKQSTIDKLDRGTHIVVPRWFPIVSGFISPLALITGVFYLGSFTRDLEARTFKDYKEKNAVINHVNDNNVHMEYQDKIKVFVPRTEIEYKLNNLEENQKKIMDKLNIIN